jgi:DNA-binding transcriptional ArsR family regulator
MRVLGSTAFGCGAEVPELAGADGPASTHPLCTVMVVSDRDDPVVEVRRRAFAALLDDRALTAAELAAASSLPHAEVEQALARLEAEGALEVDGGRARDRCTRPDASWDAA